MYSRLELRRAMRVPIEVMTSDWDESVTLRTSDLTPRGCFVSSGLLVGWGEPVVVSFRLGPWAPEMTFFGEVCRVARHRRRNDPGPGGFVIRFSDVSAMDRIRIRERLRGVPPPLPTRYPATLH